MLIVLEPNTSIDVKVAILNDTGVAVTEGDVISVEWADTSNADSKVYLVSSSDTLSTFNEYDGVVLSGDPTSVNFVRGVEATSDNIFLSNKGKTYARLLVYSN